MGHTVGVLYMPDRLRSLVFVWSLDIDEVVNIYSLRHLLSFMFHGALSNP